MWILLPPTAPFSSFRKDTHTDPLVHCTENGSKAFFIVWLYSKIKLCLGHYSDNYSFAPSEF